LQPRLDRRDALFSGRSCRGTEQVDATEAVLMSALLEIRHVSRSFQTTLAVNDVSFSVQEGELLGILGPNGAGKSTLFNLIAGVLPPNGGRILLEGRDITAMKPWDRCRIGIGRTYQVPKPFTHMTVFENVLVAAVHGGKMTVTRARGEADGVLQRVG